ncbi:HtaA domain-containing protein [Streptomyces beijiangensis]|uniref:HtaA domain-containing protein n=1 Tax=Streptomyces beijiangensis TaxID=163361 RepID=A0A939F5M8_9ACTN|nr:HtaA domain-containing protein [Streptomyces beijiangensis]MBO0512755.1 HtaA domain-containing protein [Streptomyces beijiangensis]
MLPSRPARAFAVALFAVLLGALLPTYTAQAADRTVQGGRLDWGIKSSFQSYVTGPIAGGRYALTGGAGTLGSSQFRFPSATGSYDPDSGSFRSSFAGGVRFTGHKKSDGSYELDLTISRPTVRISGGSGTLFADMTSKAKGTGKVTTAYQVPLASLGVSGINMKGGTTPIALNSVPATLTSQGARAFAGYYTAGTALDPVSLSVDTKAPAAKKRATPTPTPEATTAAAGAIQSAAVDWGVRRTFREYVTGSIAQGKWTLTGGAQDGGALFRFPQGKGTYDKKKQTLDASFAGTVRFAGKDLDVTLSRIAVMVKGGTGTLSAAGTPLITFATGELTPKNGLLTVSEVPSKLTADGAKIFGSLYKAGTDMDPVSLSVALDKSAQLPALPDLGSDPTPAPTTDAETKPPAEKASPVAAATESSLTTGTYIAIGLGALGIAAAVAGILVARKRRVRSQN